MHPEPVPADPGRDEDPTAGVPEPVEYESVAWEAGGDPIGPCPRRITSSVEQSPTTESRGGQECTRNAGLRPGELAAECQRLPARPGWLAYAARLGSTGGLAAIAAARRGPGQPGSARVFPGEYPGRAAQFATGMLMDTMPGRHELAAFADEAAGADDSFGGASDDEVLGVLCAWDRLEAHMAARKHAAVAELIRRRPAPGSAADGPAKMPGVWDEFTGNELCAVLGGSRWAADAMLGPAARPGEIPGLGPIDPDPEANTLDRYQTGASAGPGIQRINVPDRCRGAGN